MKWLMLILLPLMLISCEETDYYFSHWAGEKYICNVDETDIYLSFYDDRVIAYCPTSVLRIETEYYDMNENLPCLYLIAVNVYLEDIKKNNDGDLTAFYYSNLTGLKTYVLIKRTE